MSRRLMLKSSAGVSPVLPAEYQQVEWIGAAANSFLITNITPNVGDIYYAKCLINTYDNHMVFGERSSGAYNTSEDQVYLNCNTQNAIAFYSGLSREIFEYRPTINTIYELRATVTNAYNGMANRQFYIFALNNIGTPSAIMNGRIYKLAGTRNSETIFDYIPCYRKSDGEIGMFDTVSQTFLVNAGAGSFTKGADI